MSSGIPDAADIKRRKKNRREAAPISGFVLNA